MNSLKISRKSGQDGVATGKNTVELQPVSTNAEHEAIEIGPTTADVEIVGVVVGAIVGTRRAAEA
jgi:hypothetical protein